MNRFWMRGRTVIVAILAMAFASHAAVAQKGKPGSGGPPPVNVKYTYAPLGTLGGTYSVARGMNDHGDVVGATQGSDGKSHAFLCETGGAIVSLNSLIDPALMIHLTEARDINDRGWVVCNGYHHDGNGNYFDRSQFRIEPDSDGDGFDEVLKIARALDGTEFSPDMINNDGDVCGWSNTNGTYFAVLFSDDHGLVALGTAFGLNTWPWAITDRDVNGQVQIVGEFGYYRVWRYTGATDGSGQKEEILPQSPGNARDPGLCYASDMSDTGAIAGWSTISLDAERAAVYENGQWINLGSLTTASKYNDSEASAMNNAGQVIGKSQIGVQGQKRSFIYATGSRMTELDSLITNLPQSLVGQLQTIEIADPSPGMQFGLICGNVGNEAFVLVPDR